MAITTLLFEIKYENGNYFEMKRQEDGGDADSIIRVDEQGSLGKLWPHVEDICKQQFGIDIKAVGTEMKS